MIIHCGLDIETTLPKPKLVYMFLHSISETNHQASFKIRPVRIIWLGPNSHYETLFGGILCATVKGHQHFGHNSLRLSRTRLVSFNRCSKPNSMVWSLLWDMDLNSPLLFVFWSLFSHKEAALLLLLIWEPFKGDHMYSITILVDTIDASRKKKTDQKFIAKYFRHERWFLAVGTVSFNKV